MYLLINTLNYFVNMLILDTQYNKFHCNIEVEANRSPLLFTMNVLYLVNVNPSNLKLNQIITFCHTSTFSAFFGPIMRAKSDGLQTVGQQKVKNARYNEQRAKTFFFLPAARCLLHISFVLNKRNANYNTCVTKNILVLQKI